MRRQEAVEELQRIVAQIRAAWSQVHIVVRGDSGFCREELMSWCEAEGVDYCWTGEKRPSKGGIAKEMEEAKAQYRDRACRRCSKSSFYQTRKSWSCARRVVAKASIWRRARTRGSW